MISPLKLRASAIVWITTFIQKNNLTCDIEFHKQLEAAYYAGFYRSEQAYSETEMVIEAEKLMKNYIKLTKRWHRTWAVYQRLKDKLGIKEDPSTSN